MMLVSVRDGTSSTFCTLRAPKDRKMFAIPT